MTTRVVVFVASRLLSLWCIVSSISALASVPAMDWGLPGETRYAQVSAMVSLVLVPLAWGLVLWFGSAWVANRVSIDVGGLQPDTVPLESSHVFAMGTALLGLVVIVQVLPELANWVAFAIAARYAPTGGEPIDTTLQLQRWLYQQAGIARGVSLLARLAVGIVFLLGPGRLWRGLRSEGIPHDEVKRRLDL